MDETGRSYFRVHWWTIHPQFLFHHSDNLLLRGESTVQWKEEMVLYLRLNLPSQYSTIIGVPRWWDAYVLANLIAPAHGFFFLSSVGLSTILYYPSFQLSTHYAVHNLFLFFSFLLLSLFLYYIFIINITFVLPSTILFITRIILLLLLLLLIILN